LVVFCASVEPLPLWVISATHRGGKRGGSIFWGENYCLMVQKKRGSFPIPAPRPTHSMNLHFISFRRHCHQSITTDDGNDGLIIYVL